MQVDQNGFAPIQWGSWQTNWTGETLTSSSQQQSTSGTYGIGRQLGRAGHGQRTQGLFYLHERRTFRVVNNQSRQGIRSKVVPKIERKSLGDTILSPGSRRPHLMRQVQLLQLLMVFKIKSLKMLLQVYVHQAIIVIRTRQLVSAF